MSTSVTSWSSTKIATAVCATKEHDLAGGYSSVMISDKPSTEPIIRCQRLTLSEIRTGSKEN